MNVPKPSPEFKIASKVIGPSSPAYFIADVAANHDGDLSRAIDLIYLAAEAGADAAKFQHFQASKIVSAKGFDDLGAKTSHQANWKSSVYEVYENASIPTDWTETLAAECAKAGIDFFTSPYDFEMVDLVDPFVPAYKIGSGDVTWLDMVQYIAAKNKPYILATGASSMEEVRMSVAAGLSVNPNLALLQCNTNYTGSLENLSFVNLNVLKSYRDAFPQMILGLSDHTPGHATVLGAIALEAKIIEKHFTDNTGREGPDHGFSMDPRTWREMVDRSRELEHALGDGVKRIEDNEKETVVVQRRAIRAARDLPAGHVLTASDLFPLRPCPADGLAPYEIDKILGKSLKSALCEGQHVRLGDLNG